MSPLIRIILFSLLVVAIPALIADRLKRRRRGPVEALRSVPLKRNVRRSAA